MALTVETGAGVTDADCYESAADTVARLQALGLESLAGQGSTAQEQSIRRASLDVDVRMALLVNGSSKLATQGLLYPISGATTKTGGSVADDSVPDGILIATALRAEDIAAGRVSTITAKASKVKTADGEEVTYRLAGNMFSSQSPEAWRWLKPHAHI